MTDDRSFVVRRADHVGFAVASLDAALSFWLDGLGARLVRAGEMGGDVLGEVTGARGATARMAVVTLANQTIELLEYRGVEPPPLTSRPFDAGFAHLALVVDDLDRALARIKDHGWTRQGTPQFLSAGPRAGTKVVYAVGPDGATLEFMQLPEPAQDRGPE